MNDNCNTLGILVRQARESLGYSREHLAEMLSMTARHIANIEVGKCNPSYRVVKKLVRALDISGELVFYSEQAKLSNEQHQYNNRYLASTEHEQQLLETIQKDLLTGLSELSAPQ